jgi:hypothetical protein
MIALLLAWLLASPAEAATCSGPACDEITRFEAGYVR